MTCFSLIVINLEEKYFEIVEYNVEIISLSGEKVKRIVHNKFETLTVIAFI